MRRLEPLADALSVADEFEDARLFWQWYDSVGAIFECALLCLTIAIEQPIGGAGERARTTSEKTNVPEASVWRGHSRSAADDNGSDAFEARWGEPESTAVDPLEETDELPAGVSQPGPRT